MTVIAPVREAVYDLSLQGLVKATSHLSLGQEAIAAGFGVAMRKSSVAVRPFHDNGPELNEPSAAVRWSPLNSGLDLLCEYRVAVGRGVLIAHGCDAGALDSGAGPARGEQRTVQRVVVETVEDA